MASLIVTDENTIAIMDSLNPKQINLYTNMTVCDHCEKRHATRKATIQHLANSGCDGSAICYCRQRITKENASDHMLRCRFFGPLGCTLCPGRLFKSLEKANNHAWSAHAGGRFTPLLLETVEFKMHAQVGTRFAQMQVDQLLVRARNNAQKRTILKELIKESNFAASNSKFTQLVQHFDNKCVPLFTRTQGRLREVTIALADITIRARVNMMDPDFRTMWIRLAPVVILDAQALFSIDVNHRTDDAMEGLATSISAVLEKLNVQLPAIQRVTSMCCKLVAMICSKFNAGVISALLIDMLVTSGLSMDLARTAWEMLKDHFRIVHRLFHGGMFAQAADIDPVASLATVFAIMGGAMLMKKIPKESEINDCVMGVTKLGGLVKGMTFAWQGLEKLISFILKKVYEWQTGLPAETKDLEVYMEGISEWFSAIQDIVNLRTADEIARSSELCCKLETLYREGLVFAQKAAECKAPRDILGPFNIHWSTLKTLYEKATASGAFRAGPRIEPVVIYLHGSSGVGKSGMMWPLATDLLKIDGIPLDKDGRKDPTREIYMRNIEQEYWDGYKNQRVTIYDDFAQIVDSASKPNMEFMELIRTGNLAPYPLHMATIEDKSKTYFTSRVIICTSNTSVDQIRPESISCKEAVRRRFDLVGRVQVKPGFRTTGADNNVYLDPKKVKKQTGNDISLDCYQIWLEDPLTGRIVDEKPMSYHEFSQLAVQKYKARFTKSAQMKKFLQDYADVPLQAQVLSSDEEAEWMQALDTDVKLVNLQGMTAWSGQQVCAFKDILPELQCIITEEAFFALTEFDVMHKTWDQIAIEWAQTLADLDAVWTEDAARRLKQLVKKDTMLLYSLGDVAVGLVHHVQQRCSALAARLRRESAGWLEKAKSWCSMVKAKLTEHPYISIALAVVPLLLLAIGAYMKKTLTVASGPPLDHNHTGLTRGERTLHRHKCLWCSEIFEHTHAIKTVEKSVEYPQLCGNCDRRGVISRFATRDGQTGFELISDRNMRFVPFSIGAELSGSGDVRTRKQQTLRTELAGSGDVRTRKSETLRTELSGSGDVHTRKKQQYAVEIDDFIGDDYEPVSSEDEIEAQLMNDPNAFQVSQKIVHNMYNLEIRRDDEWNSRIKICFIVGRTALTAGHLIPHLEAGDAVRIWNGSVKDGHVIPIEKIKWVKLTGTDGETKDQCLIVFPSSVHDHADIRGSIATSTELTSFKTVNGCLITPADGVVIMRYGVIRAEDRKREYNDGDRSYSIRRAYIYSLETKNGDCGAILMGVSTGLARKIIGLHVAGTIGMGMSSPLNLKDIERGLKEVSLAAQVSMDVSPLLREMTPKDKVQIPEGDFVPVGKAIYTVASPSKTALRPSAIHGVVSEPITAPSALKPVRVGGKRVDPMQQGLKKAGKIPPSLDTKRLAAAINDMERVVNTKAEPDHQRVLTNEEAVAGVEGDAFLAPINRKSSPGFPLTREKKGKVGKMRWLGEDEYKLDAEIERMMDEVVENAKNNIRTPTIWTDTLKDERRPFEKVKIGKTRVFAAGPIVYTLVFRKFFLGFAAHCAKNRIDNEISIGTNVYSLDWSRTAERLCSKGDKVIAGDFSNFDGTLVLEILAEIVEIINHFYDDGPVNAQVRRVLWKEIINSIHVCGDNVYLWTHSQPSGCPITAILNSLYNSISMRYVWLTVMPEEYCTMKAFNDHVAMVSYGDDNCVNISDSVIDKFNQLTIAAGYAEIGMTYTDEAKSGDMIPYRSINEISYLKRKFAWNEEEHQYVAPLEFSVVLEMMNWVRGDFNLEERTGENMETSAFELSLHGRTTFEQWIGKYKAASRDFEVRPMLLTYDEYRDVEAKKYGRLAAACN